MQPTKYIDKEQYEAELQKQFDSFDSERIIELLDLSKKCVLYTAYQNNNKHTEKSEFIDSIIRAAEASRKLSFKQWKALRAFCKQCKNEMISGDSTNVKSF
jgi:hypothetical protein